MKCLKQQYGFSHENIVNYVREFCSGFSGAQQKALCSQYAESMATNVEQMIDSNSPREICHQKCPACSKKTTNKKPASYACDICVFGATELKTLVEAHNFTQVS